MNLIELKNQLALDAVKIIFSNKIDCIFIGGTALNAFYVDYRFSEDADIGYELRNPVHGIVGLLGKCGYTVKPAIHPFRYIIESQGVSIKLDVLKYANKGHGFATTQLGPVSVKTLALEEFIVKLAEYPALRAGMNAKRQLHDNFPNEPSYPAHCAGSLASAREALRKI